MQDREHEALANMAAATDRRVDELADDVPALEQRVSALEAALAKLRTEIRAAAHELRDDSEFMRPYSQRVADHVADHWLSGLGKALIKWLVALVIGALIFLAGRWGLIK